MFCLLNVFAFSAPTLLYFALNAMRGKVSMSSCRSGLPFLLILSITESQQKLAYYHCYCITSLLYSRDDCTTPFAKERVPHRSPQRLAEQTSCTGTVQELHEHFSHPRKAH